jgi:NAD(P)-dependent dehydrogenase (short-subunit alcohol dehydrogenase family)
MRQPMNQPFSDRVALVTGAASGIGRAVALAFAESGARLWLSDLDQAGGEQTMQMVRQSSWIADFMRADVTQPKQVAAMIEAAVATCGRIDFAVNSAGVSGVRSRTADYPQDEWHQVIDVNLHGVWYCMRSEITQMLKQGQGVIVNLASVAGLVGFPSHAAYAASKHAVVGLTKTAALEYVRKGIRINAVCPGFIDTPMVEKERQRDPEYAQRLVRGVPARRLGTPQEVAAAVVYLCSDQAGIVAGHTLVLDGGIVAG